MEINEKRPVFTQRHENPTRYFNRTHVSEQCKHLTVVSGAARKKTKLFIQTCEAFVGCGVGSEVSVSLPSASAGCVTWDTSCFLYWPQIAHL